MARNSSKTSGSVGRNIYVITSEDTFAEIERLVDEGALSRGKFVGRLVEIGLAAYQRQQKRAPA